MTRVTRWVLAHKRLVVGFWVLMTIAGMAASTTISRHLSQKFGVPGREGFETNQQIARLYHNGGNVSPLVPVVTLPAGTTIDSPGVRNQVASAFGRLSVAVPRSRVESYASTGSNAFVSADRRTTFALIYPPQDHRGRGLPEGLLPRAQGAAASVSVAGAPLHLTGLQVLQNDKGGKGGPGVLLEAVIGGIARLPCSRSCSLRLSPSCR